MTSTNFKCIIYGHSNPTLDHNRDIAYDAGPPLNQRWANVYICKDINLL